MSTKIFKLISGEEVLADVEVQSDTITVKDALAVILQPPQPGQPKFGFAFLPWGTLVDESQPLVINKSHLVYGPLDAVPEVAAHHQKTFGKIATIPQGLVIAK